MITPESLRLTVPLDLLRFTPDSMLACILEDARLRAIKACIAAKKRRRASWLKKQANEKVLIFYQMLWLFFTEGGRYAC